MVADEDDLEMQIARGLLDDFDQARDQVGGEPAILFIEDEESLVGFGIEAREGENAQAHGENVGDAAALGAHDIFDLAVADDVELHGGCPAFEIALDFEGDGLLQHFLKGEGEIAFDVFGDSAEEFMA